jgi:trigger factor
VPKLPYICTPKADVAKLADALDLGSSAARHVGSTPSIRTNFPLGKEGFLLNDKTCSMAKIIRENLGLLHDKITVTVEKNDYLPAFEKSLKQYAKNANIPGFRKGMVPASMVRKMYGDSVFGDEVLRTMEKELNKYMTDEKLEIFGQPLPVAGTTAPEMKLSDPKDYSFEFEVGLKPDYDVNNWKNQPFKNYKVTVTDTMIDEEVDRLRNRHGNMTHPEVAETDEHILNVKFIELVENTDDVLEGGIAKDNSLLVKYFADHFRPLLIGKKGGDSMKVELNSAFEEKERGWVAQDLGLDVKNDADMNKQFKMEIEKIGLLEKAPIDEALFEAAFPGKALKDETAFRAEVSAGIQNYWDAQSKNQLNDQIYHAMVDHTKIDLPETFLKRWIETAGEKPKTAEEAEAEMPSFKSSLKWTLLSDRLIYENGISVSREDIKLHTKQQLMGYMNDPSMMDAPWLDGYADKMMADQKYVENTYNKVAVDKLFTWAGENVTASEVAIDAEAFTKMVNEHQH